MPQRLALWIVEHWREIVQTPVEHASINRFASPKVSAEAPSGVRLISGSQGFVAALARLACARYVGSTTLLPGQLGNTDLS